MDIVNLTKAVEIIATLGNISGKVLEDGKINTQDLASAPELVMVIPALFGLKFKELPAEFKDLDASEKEILVAKFKEKFDLPQDKIEAKIEAGLSLLVELEEVVIKFIALIKA